MGYKTMKKAVGRHGAPPGILPTRKRRSKRGSENPEVYQGADRGGPEESDRPRFSGGEVQTEV